MKNTIVLESILNKHDRMEEADKFSFSYKNPHILAALYYVEGLSTTQMAEHLSCHKRTIRRYMNYFAMPRFTKHFSQLVRHHGIDGARQIQDPEFGDIGDWTD
ncbi:helix-turn-helix domain-containing protein [Bacillus thuringiensis]|uniref:helix-turn-helix domain-containing protein n=1 Tax=Bacillus thuringiensis TaxID=1428 RepID=UPI000BFC6F70|nr:helix-turn-helix domain-containing protein [Bacillus thuringiensis]PGL88574.1 helix-turn-helix domain-containing protein [Bacillus thuringiensis]